MTATYFAADGSYGNAEGLIIVDTSDWTEEEWDIIDETTDSTRVSIAEQLAKSVLGQDALPGLDG
jgi:hypothetical protein